VNEVSRCEEEGTMLGTPGKHHSMPKRITNPNDFDLSVIRRTVYDFYTQEDCEETTSKTQGNHKFQGRYYQPVINFMEGGI
jgi:hypothetical protein